MTDLVAKFLRDITAPLGGALFRAIIALALVMIALAALSAAMVVANFWLYTWLATLVTPLQALGIVIGAWVGVALIALIAAWVVMRKSKVALASMPKPADAVAGVRVAAMQADAGPQPADTLASQIDAMVDPLATMLTAMGFQKETAALVAGARAVRTFKTTQLSALALIVGYAAARAFTRKT